MPKSVNLGNGVLLIGLDKFGQVKDFYYHYPGLENHVSEYLTHKIGIYVEDRFTWIDDGSWNLNIKTEEGTMASDITAKNDGVGISLKFNDVIYNEKNIFLREVSVTNNFDRSRKVKIFFNQQFNIGQTHRGETAYYDPVERVMIHYKGRRVFLVNASVDAREFSEYSVGLLGIEGKDGTFKDAEDGHLSGNAIEHGQVDSVIAQELEIPPKESKTVYYWICVGKSIRKVKDLHGMVLAKTPFAMIKSTKDYWRAWVNVQNFSFYGLAPPIVDLFKQSLFNIRVHTSKNGAIIASGDSEMLQFGRDYYEYVWPRDASFAAIALGKAGDFNTPRHFFKFCEETVTEKGYFMHKYRPDKSLGASWHPWVRNGKKQLPIQEDETALVIYGLWKYYELSRDLEFIEGLFNTLIRKAGDFMVSYRDDKTGLPSASYDLWEQDYGTSTFTASCVYAALLASSRFAKLLGKDEIEKKYSQVAQDIKRAILKYLYDPDEKIFYKLIDNTERETRIDRTIDMSSIYSIYKFEVLSVDDEIVKKAMEKTVERLEVKTEVGGIARFEGDSYHHKGGNYPGNPWVITSMWIAQYYIGVAKTESDLEPVRRWISWVVKNASSSKTLPEQFDPYSGEHLSASPLVWSHAEFVITIVSYLEKLEELGICKACYPLT